MDEPLFTARKERLIVAVTTVVIAVTRFAALARAPWDWDEVLFCLALGDYNVAAHQPHPAGFPLYVLLARVARFFTGSDFHALQTVNVIAGMAAFPVMYWAARAFRFDFVSSVAAGVLFAFLPNVWFYGGTGFSDVPAMVCFLAAIAAYMGAGLSTRRSMLAALLMAAGILIRPQNAVVVVFPWTLAAVRLVRAKRYGTLVLGSLVTAAAVVLGYGLAAWATGGFDLFVNAIQAHSHYVRAADSVNNVHRPPLWEVVVRQLDPYYAGKASLLMNLLALAAIIRGHRQRVLEVLLTFAPFFLFALLAVNPLGSSRFALNYMAGVVLLAIEGTLVLASFLPRYRLAARVAVVAVLVLRFGTWMLPAFEVPRTRVPPPAAAAMWMREHVPADAAIFVDDGSWPWVRYYTPEHRHVRVASHAGILDHPEARNGWYMGTTTTTSATAMTFAWPRNRTWNVVTRRYFEAYAQPAANLVDFGSGWHLPEGSGDDYWRWSQQTAHVRLGPVGGKAELYLKFGLPVDVLRKPITVTFTFNGAEIGRVTSAEHEQEVRYVVDARGDRANVLRIHVSDAFVPARYGSHDERELGLMLRLWKWRRVADETMAGP